MNRLLVPVTIALLGVASLSGCKKDDSGPTSSGVPESARVMLIHASPDAPGFDLFVDGAVVDSNLTFPNNTSYRQLSAGDHSIKVNITGTTTTVVSAIPYLVPNTSYSVFAVALFQRSACWFLLIP